ncbi:MAG: immunoglobulin-like domain-containing protein [Paludibacter sp.]
MKKIILITFVAALILSACKEESLGVSSIITYPTMKLKGDVALTIPVGGSYTDTGCSVTEGDLDLSKLVTVSGTVNPSVVGVYTITYTYKNAGKIVPTDSLTMIARRYIGVITAAASAMDISGSYKRNAGVFGVATVTKTSYPGLYINNNPGGAAVNNLFVYMFQTDAKVVTVPSQESVAGEFACTGGVYDATGASPLFKWVCVNAGYGTAVRTFIKQ